MPIITVDSKFVMKVIDFGEAESLEDLNAQITQSGNKKFEPEEASEGKACPKGDIWSFGCMMFELLEGKEFAYKPGQQNKIHQLLDKILADA